MTAKICPCCHATIPPGAPEGFCPACVLRGADETAHVGPPGGPPLEDVRAAFPQLEVQALIGHGGMGFVYKARQPSLDRTVALKILAPALGRDPAFAERFAREARVLAKLSHPNIVTVFEHGITQPSTPNSQPFYYLLMEYVDGVNLRQAMRAGRFTPEQALSVVPGICDALQAAHAQGIWHRDIKPENILLDLRGGVKIADFGIARLIGDPARDFTITVTGAALGSAAYMAPEQHEKPHDVDHRADIYSLGVVIYEMLTGELPLGRFPAPSQRAAVDARIDEIVLRTLEKERALRQQSAEEVKTEVTQATSYPPRAHPAPARSWTPVILSQMAVVAGLVLFAGAAALTHGSTQNTLLTLSLVPFVLGLVGLFLFRRREVPQMQKRYFTRGLSAGALLAGITVAVVAIIEYNNTARALARARLAEERETLLAVKAAAERQAATELRAATNPGIDWNPGATGLPKPVTNSTWWAWAENLKNAEMLRMRGDLSGALQSCLASLEDARKLATHEKSPRQLPLARSLLKTGDLYCALGRLDEALKHYQESFVSLEKLFVEEPSIPDDHRKQLTQAFVKTGDVLRALGRKQEADEHYRVAVAGFPKSQGREPLSSKTEGGHDLAGPLDEEELARLIAAPDIEDPNAGADRSRRLRYLICRAGAEKAVRFRYLLEQEKLRKDFPLPLAAYDFSVNGNTKALDFILTKLAAQQVGSDCDEPVVLAFVDEWERSPAAVNAHFTSTDGAGSLNRADFWTTRMYLFPRNYLLYKIKDLEGAPLKPGIHATTDARVSSSSAASAATPLPASDDMDVLKVVRKMNILATELNVTEFRKYAPERTGLFAVNRPVAETMQEFAGELLGTWIVSLKEPASAVLGLVTKGGSAKVLVQIRGRNGSTAWNVLHFEALKDGWKYKFSSSPVWRSTARLEFRPAQGDPQTLLGAHMDKDPGFVAVKDEPGVFEIWSESEGEEDFAPKRAQTILQNELLQLTVRLQRSGLDGALKILAQPNLPVRPAAAGTDPRNPPAANNPATAPEPGAESQEKK